jgi:hypothetical protein
LFDQHQAVGDVALTACREIGLERHDVGVEAGQLGLELAFGADGVDPVGRDRLQLGAQAGDLATRDEDAQCPQLDDDLFVTACRLGLAFERTELATDLA